MRNYLKYFFDACEYPIEASESLLNDFNKLMSSPASKEVFEKHIAIYESGDIYHTREALNDSINIAKEVGVSEYASQLLIFACFTKKLKELFLEKGWSEDLWLHTMLDLRYKMYECKKFHDVWGSFVAFWFPEFFELKRLTFGRLQYQNCIYWATENSYTINGTEIKRNETPAYELHIPSAGPLNEDLVLESLKLAYNFYKENNGLVNGLLVCECSSWLLYERMTEFLPENSNIAKFQKFFELTYQNEDPGFEDCWRIFNKDYNNDPTKLPRETTLQKCFAEWLEKGNNAGTGVGLIIFDGEKIISKRKN